MKAFQKVVFLVLVWQCELGTSTFLRHNSSRDTPNSEDCEANLCVGSHCDLDACDACDSCKIVEVQRVTVSGRRWQSVTFADPFQVVPVVVMLPNTDGHHPATIRIKDVTKTGFKAVITEPPKQDGPHKRMKISYMAAIPGTHKLGGKAFNVRVHETSSTVSSKRGKCKSPGPAQTWDDVAFQSVFAEPPAFVAAVQTMNNEKNRVPTKTSAPFLTVAAKELTKDGVKLARAFRNRKKRR